MSERHYAKRNAGISPIRTDGSLTSPYTDEQSAAAERFAAERFGAKFNDEVYDDHGDDGHDFLIGERTVEVVWLGVHKNTTTPRYSGHLIVNPHEPHRHADLYVVVAGTIARGLTLIGWAAHSDLTLGRDFGYGERLSLPTSELHAFTKLDAA